MINRFRVEGREDDKEKLIEHLSSTGARIIGLLDQKGEWECTEDVITRVKHDTRPGVYLGYAGRMTFKFRPRVSEPPPWVEPGNVML